MDYSKLNNIAASIQDVENTASIVENRLNTKIDEDIQSLQDAISDIGNNPSESIDSNVISAALNDLSDKTDNLNKDVEDLERVTSSSLNDLNIKVEEQEKVTSSSLNDLNDKVDNLNDKVNNTELVTASALNNLNEKVEVQEKVTSNALNNLNEKIELINTNIENLICTLTISILIDGLAYTYKNVNIEITYQGNTITNWGINNYTNLTTNSNGQIIINIPYGSQYKIIFTGTSDYIEPDTINGVADDINKNYIV